VSFDFSKILYALMTILIISNYGLLTQGINQKLAARVGRRNGIRLYQPWIDIIKNLAKRTMISHGFMFDLGPVFRLTGGVGVLLFTPVVLDSPYFQNFSFAGDMILILYFMFFGMLGMALGAGEGGHPYSVIGITRGLAQATAYELPLTLSILAVAAQYNSLSVTEIALAQQGGILNWTVFTNPLAVAAGMLSILGSFGQGPFNIVMAPQEIPIGPPTEYQSAFLGVLALNRTILPVAKLALFANLFFGGAASLPQMFIKVFFMSLFVLMTAVVFPRFRPEQAIRWFFKVPLLTALGSIVFVMFFLRG
jgi:NADH-quinone oxidoreductase subunit H